MWDQLGPTIRVQSSSWGRGGVCGWGMEVGMNSDS